MGIFNYNDFLINEALVALSNDIISKLKKVSDILTDNDKEWVDKIIDKSGDNIESSKLDDRNSYFFDLTDDPKYFDMEITKPLSSSIQSFKVGRALKILAPDIPADILSNITSALQSQLDYEIKVVDGNQIIEYYNYDNISPEGTLGRSCMNNMDDEFFFLYSKNDEVVKLAILLDEDEVLLSRALLWKTNIGWIMDRIYYSSDKYEYLFKDWAKENNYILKEEIEDKTGDIKIQLKKSEFEYYPYLDTFKYICLNLNQLSNDDIFGDEDEVGLLESTDGEITPYRNLKLRYQAFHDLSEARWSRDLTAFINYSIDYDKWLDDFISEEMEQFYNYPKDFIDVYGGYIKYNFDKLSLDDIDKDITKDNLSEMIMDFHENYTSKYEDVLDRVIRLRYSKEEGYVSWVDWHDEIYGGEIGSYNSLSKREKDFYDNFMRRYCSIDILNKNLSELYETNYDTYERILYKIGY